MARSGAMGSSGGATTVTRVILAVCCGLLAAASLVGGTALTVGLGTRGTGTRSVAEGVVAPRPAPTPSPVAGGADRDGLVPASALEAGAIPDLPSDPGDVAPPASPAAPAVPDPAAIPGPRFEPVVVGVPRLAVRGAAADASTLVALARGVDGVVHAAAVHVAAVALDDGRQVVLAAVDPAAFRALTPQVTADHLPVWERVAAGDAVLDYAFGQSAGLALGASTSAGDVALRIGAFASIGTPPVADAIVNPALGARLGVTGIPPTLLVAPDPAVPLEQAAAALAAAVGVAPEVLADPTARSGPVPVGVEVTPENVWDHLARCESSGDWQINTGNGYYGGVQFLPESWHLVGGTGLPHEHTREEQIYRATLLWQIQGWEAWPQCARRLGLIVEEPLQ